MKALTSKLTAQQAVETLLADHLKIWEKESERKSYKRIYMKGADYAKLLDGTEWSDNNNVLYYDFETQSVMREYKRKKATVDMVFAAE